jgi:hypothetical protein
MPLESLVEAVSDSGHAMDTFCRRQLRETRVARRLLQRGQGDDTPDQHALAKEAFCRFEPDQIVEQLRRSARRRREFGRLRPSQIKCADDASVLGNEPALLKGREALAASWTAIQQTGSMSATGHDACAPPTPSEIRRLVLGEAHRTELQPRRACSVGLGSSKRQKERSLGADRHGRDLVAADARLMVQEVQHGFRQGEIETRRPGAGADAEALTEMARRQAMGEGEAMQPTRQQLVMGRRRLHRPAFRNNGREARLHFDRGTGGAAHRRPTAVLGAALSCAAPTREYIRARRAFAA